VLDPAKQKLQLAVASAPKILGEGSKPTALRASERRPPASLRLEHPVVDWLLWRLPVMPMNPAVVQQILEVFAARAGGGG
jgi:hypothetical protein